MLKVSIITVVRNRQSTIEAAIKSVLGQSYSNIEYIVIDGASTDDTVAVVSQYRERISVLVSEPDRGIYDALNKGVGLATGDIVGFLHSDDVYAHQDVVSQIVSFFSSTECDGLYTDLVYFESQNSGRIVRCWRSRRFSKKLLALGWMPPHPTLFVRRSLYLKLGKFRTDLKISADYDFIVRLFKAPVKIEYLPIVSYRMRTGGVSNRNLRQVYEKTREDWSIIREHHVGGVFTLILKTATKLSQFFVR